MESIIGNAIEKLNQEGNYHDGFIPEDVIWSYIENLDIIKEIGSPKKAYMGFLSSLHTNRSSLAFFESIVDDSTGDIKWRLRSSIQDISVLSQNDDINSSQIEKNYQKSEELAKEYRKLLNEIAQLEIENSQLSATIDNMKQISNQNLIQSFSLYERLQEMVKITNSSFSDIEKQILTIGTKTPKV